MRDRFTWPTEREEYLQGRARERNARDLATLACCRAIVVRALTGLRRIPEIEHPEARWSPADLEGALTDHLADIDAIAQRIAEE